jgi:hypothetical protein
MGHKVIFLTVIFVSFYLFSQYTAIVPGEVGKTFQHRNDYYVLSHHYAIAPNEHKIIRVYFPYFASHLKIEQIKAYASIANEFKTNCKRVFPYHREHGVDAGVFVYGIDQNGNKYIEISFHNLHSGGTRYIALGLHISVHLIPTKSRLDEDESIDTVDYIRNI